MAGLMLKRKKQERIFIGDNIIITFVDFQQGKAVIHITAPREIPIHREEIRGGKHIERSESEDDPEADD